MANPKIEVEIGARITELDRKLDQVDNKLNQTGKSFKKLNEFAVGALQGIAAAFTIGAVVDFGRAVLDTTAKFQKFSAVLTNTLGSDSAAQQALIQIQNFASQTPFAVDELTESFVKLANQGFRPTISELRSLGDLASSTGKSFDQLAEAIIDAQVGEFERLKEFGVRASVEGDKVTFTFKGVETQVNNTSEAIRGYVLSLGDAEGVSGAMSSISETLGGKISNLGDNIEQLKLAIGDRTSGVFAASIDWLNEFISLATSAIKSTRDIRDAVISTQDAQDVSETRKEIDFLVGKLSQTLPIQEAINRAVDLTKQSYRDLSDDISRGVITAGKLGFQLNAIEQIRVDLLTEQNQKIAEAQKLRESELNSLNKLKRTYEDVSKLTIADRKLPGTTALPTLPSVAGVNTTPLVNQFKQTLDQVSEEFKSFSGDFLGVVQDLALNINNTIRGGLFNAFSNLGNDLGQALATGANVVETIGRSLLNSMGAFLGDLGQQLVAYGVAGLAFTSLTEAIKKGGPLAVPAAIGAIAAGTAMIAIGSAFRNIAGGGLSVSSGGGRSVSGVGVGGQTFGGSGLESSLINGLEVTGLIEVDGTKLLIALENATKKRNRG